MEIKRGSTANESISLQRESATGHCGRKLQFRRRDARTAVICKAVLKGALPWSGVVAEVRLQLFRLEAVHVRVPDQNRCGVLQHSDLPFRAEPPVIGGGRYHSDHALTA